MKHSFLFALLLFTLASCNTKPKAGFAIITIDSPKSRGLEYRVSKIKFKLYQELIELSKGRLSTEGIKIINIPLANPTFITTEIGKVNYTIYLEPGYDLHLSTTDSSVIFSGSGSVENNYLLQSSKFWNQCNSDAGNYINQSPTNYGYFLDSVSTELAKFNGSFFENNAIPNHTLQVLETINKTQLIALKSIYKFVNPAAFIYNDSISKPLLNIFNRLPFERKYLNYGMTSYFNSLDFYNRFEVISSLIMKANGNDSIIEQAPVIAYKTILKTDSIKDVKEFLLAKNISFWLSDAGITPAIDSIYSDFKKDFADSEYLTPLKTQYGEFYALTPGQPAPEITGVSIKGDTITLSSLKGKIVFIDVWATWCGPCLAEFPFYTSIQGKFKENKEVVFLFVSKDSDKEKWKDYVENKMKITGIQLLELENKTHPSLSESYKLWGIPHYILIDKEGKIAINKAPWPSSGKVIDEIKSLL